MFQSGDVVLLKATKEVGIILSKDNEKIHAYFQAQGEQFIFEYQIVKQNIFNIAQSLKQYRNELKKARSENKSSDLIEYLAQKVKEYFLLYEKEEGK